MESKNAESGIFIQVSELKLSQIIQDAVQSAMPQDFKQSEPQPFIKGIHELAAFLKVSPARAQKLKNENVFPFWQDNRTLLFDPDKVRAAMTTIKAKGRK
jgi:hypothetical protein